jgi:hypothetical protein
MRNFLLGTAVIAAALCFAGTAQAQRGCGYGGYGARGGFGGYSGTSARYGAYYRAPAIRPYGYVPRTYTYTYGPGYFPGYSYGPGYYPSRGYSAYYGPSGYLGRGGLYNGRGGASMRIGF